MKHLSVCVSSEVYEGVHAISRRQGRTEAEVVEEALSRYVAAQLEEEDPQPGDAEAVSEGRNAYAAGECM